MTGYGLVSIITPTWACADFIAETIKSIQAQTYQNWELLIQDDYSKDNTLDVVKPFIKVDKRIKYECNDQNLGAAITRNTALRRAQGRWIAFLDSDDLWHPQKLEKQLKFMMEKGYHFSYTRYEEINEDSKLTGYGIKNTYLTFGSTPHNTFLALFVHGGLISCIFIINWIIGLLKYLRTFNSSIKKLVISLIIGSVMYGFTADLLYNAKVIVSMLLYFTIVFFFSNNKITNRNT